MNSSLTVHNRQALLYHRLMVKRNRLRWVLGSIGSIAALLLLVWLIVVALSNTRLSADVKNQAVAAETTLGDVTCRKTLTRAFPFFALKCQETSKNPVKGDASPSKQFPN